MLSRRPTSTPHRLIDIAGNDDARGARWTFKDTLRARTEQGEVLGVYVGQNGQSKQKNAIFPIFLVHCAFCLSFSLFLSLSLSFSYYTLPNSMGSRA